MPGRKLLSRFLPPVLFFLLAGGCGKSDEPTDPGDQPLPAFGRFVFTLDSVQCNTTGQAGIDSTGWIIVLGSTNIKGAVATVAVVLTDATVAVNTPIMLADPTLDKTHGGAFVAYGDLYNPTALYETEAQGATGTVVLASRSNNQISGRCSFKAKQVGGVAQKILEAGAFNVAVAPMKISVQERLKEMADQEVLER